MDVDFTRYQNQLSFKSRCGRALWMVVYALGFRWTPSWPGMFSCWRVFLLRCFGAKIGRQCAVAPSIRVWAPWNLIMHDAVLLDKNCRVYDVDRIEIHSQVIVSENVFLCTASHNIRSSRHELTHRPIVLKGQNWVAADVFIGPGVTIEEGTVLGARAVVTKDVAAWKVVAGNPAKIIGERKIVG